MTSTPELALQPDHDLGGIRPMPEFRKLIEQDALTEDERAMLVEQAAVMVDGLYVHLLHKRAMYAIEPSQRLRLLRRRLAQLSDAQFHSELLRVFFDLHDLHDLHTVYVLPRPYQGPSGPRKGPFAFLGILLEQYWKDEEPHWLVSKVFAHLHTDPQFVRGAEVLHWNGLDPRDPEPLAGVRQRRGSHPCRQGRGRRWGGNAGDALAEDETPPSQLIGLDLNTEPQRPELRARTVRTAHGTFGHLRIDTFHLKQLHPLSVPTSRRSSTRCNGCCS